MATELARRHPPAGLVLETPFTSVRDMAKIALPFLPVGPFLRTRYDTLSAIADVDAPLLVLHGDRDRIVPLEQGRRVFEASPGRKTFFLIPGADHNDTYVVGGEAWIEAWRAFLATIS